MTSAVELYHSVRPYIGQMVQYIDELGLKQQRILEKIQYNPIQENHTACFRHTNKVKKFLFEYKYVPLTDVIIPSNPKSRSGFFQPREHADTINHNGKTYNVTQRLDFTAGDEVVWIIHSNENNQFTGKVVRTVEHEDDKGQVNSVAIVSLETFPPMSKHLYPPRYMKDGIKHAFFIRIDELLRFDDWINIMIQEKNDEQRFRANFAKRNNDKQSIGNDKNKENPSVSSPMKPAKNKPSHSHSFPGEDQNFNEEFRRNREFWNSRESSKNSEDLKVQKKHVNSDSDEKQPTTKEPYWQLSMNKNGFSKTAKQTDGNRMGIEGDNNSCYMDASLFALFSFTEVLDKFLLDENGEEDNCSSQVKKIIRNDIVFPMRQEKHLVPYENTRKLRRIFKKEVSKQYRSQYMDVEEFLSDLFQLLKAPAFIHYDNGESDHIHQIALPFTWEENQYKPYITLQTLLDDSFKTFEVKLEKVPDDIFIIKLPVSDGVLIPCTGVIPNLTLNLRNVLATDEVHDDMTLNAVICLRHSHFVTFVRTGASLNSKWVYMDSRPTTNEPYVCLLQDIGKSISAATKRIEMEPCDIESIEPKCENYLLFQHAYICVYVKQKI